MSGSIWTRLGIERTDDSRAIKKAYAARLKAIDPDRDPQAFIALREARDTALRHAGPAAPAFEAPAESEPPSQARVEAPLGRVVEVRPADAEQLSVQAESCREPGQQVDVAQLPSPRQRPSPWETPSVDDHMRRIEALLFSPAGEAADPEPLCAEVEKLLRHPGMETIGRGDEVEVWLAQAIVDAIPRSDPLLEPAMQRFDWQSKAQEWECPWYIEEAVARWHDCRFRDHGLDGEHGPAMRRLAKPPPQRTDFLMAWAVASFLRKIRADHPSIEREFDAETISWWDHEIARRRRRFPWVRTVALAVALLGVEHFAGTGQMVSAASAAAALTGAVGWFWLKRRLEHQVEEAGGIDPAEPPPLSRAQAAALTILLLLPLAASASPAGPLALIAYAAAAGGLALLVGPVPPPPDEDPADTAWQARIAILAPILWLHGLFWANGMEAQALVPIMAAAWAAFVHGGRVRAAVFDGRRDMAVRAPIVACGLILSYRIAEALSESPNATHLPFLLALAVILVIVHQIADPPDPWQKEWKAGSVIAIMAAALGGPLFAMMLVVARTGRAAADLRGD